MLKRQNNLVFRIFSSVILLFFGFCCLVSCKSVSNNGDSSLEDSWYNYSDSSIYVQLEANATTGYEWTVSVEGSSVVVIEDEYVPDDAPLGMVGVGGTWKCKLDVVEDGQAVLHFVYARPWDKSNTAETRTLLVSVVNGKITQVIFE